MSRFEGSLVIIARITRGVALVDAIFERECASMDAAVGKRRGSPVGVTGAIIFLA